MSRKAGVVSIDIQAGTSKFTEDMGKAQAKMREFGASAHGSVTGVQAVSASLRVMEGNMTNNLRAAERFVANTLGMGPILQKAFPVVGAIAFLGVVSEMGTKVRDFFREMREAPDKAAAGFRTMTAGIRSSNDELLVANDRLENDIAKLEGRRQNTLKLALDEAAVSADKLGESLSSDLAKVNKLLTENVNDFWQRLMGGSDVAKQAKLAIGGESGTGGSTGKVEGIIDAANQQIADVIAKAKQQGTPGAMKSGREQVESIRTQAMKDAQKELGEATIKVNDALAKQRELLDASATGFYKNGTAFTGMINPDLLQKDIEVLSGAKRGLDQMQRAIPLRIANAGLTDKHNAAQADRENGKLDNPFKKWQAESSAALAALKADLEAIGKSEAAQVMAKAFGDAQKELAKLDNELLNSKGHLEDWQIANVYLTSVAEEQTKADIKWGEKLDSTTVSIAERIKSQEMLTAAIGRGYEATKAAIVETRLMAEMKDRYNDPHYAPDQAKLRTGFGAEVEAEHGDQIAKSVQALREQIQLEQELARVQSQGAEAVRQVTFAAKLRQMTLAGATREQIAAEMELYNAQRLNSTFSETAKVSQQIEDTERLAAATLKGAEAVRQATLENKLAQIARDGDVAGPGGFGIKAMGAVVEDAATHKLQVTREAAHADRVRQIEDEIALLKEAQGTEADTLALEIKLRDLENERLQTQVQQTLQIGTAGAGIKAFFLEMQENAKSTANIVYETLNSTFDRTSANLAKMMTQKPPKGGWGQQIGKDFQGIGEQAIQSTLKTVMQKGLGKLGAAAGVKRDGSTEDAAFWVKIAGVGYKPAGSPGTSQIGAPWDDTGGGDDQQSPVKAMGIGGKIFSFFSGLLGGGKAAAGGTGGGGISPNAFGGLDGMMAEGGNMDVGRIYGVAEAGEAEIITPRNASTITPLHKLGGGGDNHVHFNTTVDARGAEIGVENRVHRVIEAAHQDAIASAVRASHERQRRTVRGGR